MDVFLSGYDLWLHEHFFPYAWQVALVIEPHSRHGGFFVRTPDGQPHPQHYTGFGELVRPSKPTFPEAQSAREGPQGPRSVVNWTNLRADGTALSRASHRASHPEEDPEEGVPQGMPPTDLSSRKDT
jgi:hypothetical protein